MIISVEISIYPMDKNYSVSIREFIDRMNQYKGINLKVNEMSSFISGEYDEVMKAITQEMKNSFMHDGIKFTVLKMVNLDMTEQ